MVGSYTKYEKQIPSKKDLLPAAADCYKGLRELPSMCLSAWEGQKIANRIRDYIDALEKELINKKHMCGATFELANGEFVSPCHKPNGHISSHEGYCLGSPCIWPQGFSSEEELKEEIDTLGWIN